MNLATGSKVDRYVVEGLLGKGGMAAVYRVRHATLGSTHAMKVLTLTAPSVQERLMAEGRAQSTLRHPNVVAVTDVVEARGCPALVMEFIDGPALDALLANHRLTLAQADHIGQGILRGVAAAHLHGLVHRDLKPANVLLALHDGQLIPKVADFGLAKTLSEDEAALQTRSGVTMGTPAYMAPEQVRNARDVDERADVFSLGAMLYELVTGTRAFRGEDTLALFNAVASGAFVPPRQLVPELPERMETAILGALQVDRNDRTPSVAELLEVWSGGTVGASAWDDKAFAVVDSLRSDPPASGAPSDQTWSETFPGLDDDESLSSVPDENRTLAADDFIDSRLLQPADSWSWRRRFVIFAGGVVASVPFSLGVTSLMLGSLGLVDGGGLWSYGLLVLAPLGCGALAVATDAERHGRQWVLGWVVPILLVMVFGALGTMVGQALVAHYTATFTDPDAASMMTFGAGMATLPDLTSLALASAMCAGACCALAWAHWPRDGQGLPTAGLVASGVALLGGSVLWVAHPYLAGGSDYGTPAPFFVFLVLMVGTLANAALVGQDQVWRVRVLVLLLTSAGTSMAARAVDLQTLRAVNDAFARSTDVGEKLVIADTFAQVASLNVVAPVLWSVLALVAGGICLARLRTLPMRGWQLAGLVALLAVHSGTRAKVDFGMAAAMEQVVPVALAAAAHHYLGSTLQDAEDGPTVVDARDPLQPGDVVVLLESRVVRDVRSLVADLHACACETPGKCALDDCVQAGSRVQLTVQRGGAETEELSVTILAGADPEAIARNRPLRERLEDPFLDFVMEPNASVSERSNLRRPKNWHPALLDAVSTRLERIGDRPRYVEQIDRAVVPWLEVLEAVRAAGQPDIFAAIPFVESQYRPDVQSAACAKGIWQFVPETALANGLRVEDCRMKGTEERWAPGLDYRDPDGCRILARKGCTVDERTDTALATRAALRNLDLAWKLPVVRDSGAAVQLTLASHTLGVDRVRAQVEHLGIPERPGALWVDCEGCDERARQIGRKYVASVVADHVVAVCRFLELAPDDPRLLGWRRHRDGYCSALEL